MRTVSRTKYTNELNAEASHVSIWSFSTEIRGCAMFVLQCDVSIAIRRVRYLAVRAECFNKVVLCVCVTCDRMAPRLRKKVLLYMSISESNAPRCFGRSQSAVFRSGLDNVNSWGTVCVFSGARAHSRLHFGISVCFSWFAEHLYVRTKYPS